MKKVMSLLAMCCLSAVLSLPAIAQESATPAATGKMNRTEQGEGRERHPMIRKAIRALENAKNDLQHAAHDFGGHRADALKACDQAIEQLKLALQYDKR